MPQGYAELWTSLPAPLDRAQQYLERRGDSLPETARRALAREVILRVSRAALDAETAFVTPEIVHQADRAEADTAAIRDLSSAHCRQGYYTRRSISAARWRCRSSDRASGCRARS